jgi:hypothetical protein
VKLYGKSRCGQSVDHVLTVDLLGRFTFLHKFTLPAPNSHQHKCQSRSLLPESSTS